MTRKQENKIWAGVFGGISLLAVFGTIWNGCDFVIALASALLCMLFIRESKLSD